MKIVCLADTHGFHEMVKVPPGDVFIYAGDFTGINSNLEIMSFNAWIGKLPHLHKLCVAGNHDRCLENRPDTKKLFTNCVYLQDKSYKIDGMIFYGSPFQPEFCSWAFNLPRGIPLRDKWRKIPKKTDVLITHGPPYGIMDLAPIGGKVGCADLLEAVQKIKPKLHIFGHIHEGHGKVEIDGTTFINASICTGDYDPINKPIVVEI
jgi:Icc-related predicted phosphoesterase